MVVTEFGCMTVKPDHDVLNEDTPEGKILSESWHAVANQPTGPYRVFYGLEVENPSKLWGFFDFASVEEHRKFAKEFGVKLVADLPKILADSEIGGHVPFMPNRVTAHLAPVTEVLLAFFRPDISENGKKAAAARVEEFLEKAGGGFPELLSTNHGWLVENDLPVRGVEPAQEGSLLMILCGWESIDSHMRFRETEAFKRHIALLTDMEGLIKLSETHVKFQSIENHTRKWE